MKLKTEKSKPVLNFSKPKKFLPKVASSAILI